MTKNELQRIALRLFNKEDTDFELIQYSEEMKNSTDKEYVLCCDYVVEIFRIGKTEFRKKYCIKEYKKNCGDCGKLVTKDRWVNMDDPNKYHPLCPDCYSLYDDPAYM